MGRGGGELAGVVAAGFIWESEAHRLVFRTDTDWNNPLFSLAEFFIVSWGKRGRFKLLSLWDWEDIWVNECNPLTLQAAPPCNPFHKRLALPPRRSCVPSTRALTGRQREDSRAGTAAEPLRTPSSSACRLDSFVHTDRGWLITLFLIHNLGNFLGN